ncbi:MAG: septal ring lytic transglycosylase RlpA family protein [Actinobacteria bacterium]|nr:septal ring lytic transglycosylase RlpA family protein [Actinomycetota bacterium]
MIVSVRRMVLFVALFGGVLLAASAVLLDGTGGHEPFRAVVGVRHSAEIEAPRASRTRPSQTMIASYLDYSLAGAMTASGEPFDPEGYTAAHRTLPLGTRLLVSYGGKSVRVTVNDRGPHVAGYDLDLSLAAAREIGLTGPGSAPVRVTVL